MYYELGRGGRRVKQSVLVSVVFIPPVRSVLVSFVLIPQTVFIDQRDGRRYAYVISRV